MELHPPFNWTAIITLIKRVIFWLFLSKPVFLYYYLYCNFPIKL